MWKGRDDNAEIGCANRGHIHAELSKLCKGDKEENALSWKVPFCPGAIAVQIELLLLHSIQYTELLFRDTPREEGDIMT